MMWPHAGTRAPFQGRVLGSGSLQGISFAGIAGTVFSATSGESSGRPRISSTARPCSSRQAMATAPVRGNEVLLVRVGDLVTPGMEIAGWEQARRARGTPDLLRARAFGEYVDPEKYLGNGRHPERCIWTAPAADGDYGVLIEAPDHPEGVEEKDLLAVYIRQISRYALLTAADEQEIGEAILAARVELARHAGAASERTRTRAARRAELERRIAAMKNRLITGNLRLVVSVAKEVPTPRRVAARPHRRGQHRPHRSRRTIRSSEGLPVLHLRHWWIKQASSRRSRRTEKSIKIPGSTCSTRSRSASRSPGS